MAEHLSREEIAGLLDGPVSATPARRHLDRCDECMQEFEQLARIRMALSALPDRDPPAGQWERIRERLQAAGTRFHGKPRRAALSGRMRFAWAAAIIGLFAAGLGIGHQLSVTGPGAPGSAALRPGSIVPTESATDPYQRNLAQMEALRHAGPSGSELAEDPSLAAERLMRLDALIEASREALRTAPADPALNDFLFEVVDQRASLAGRLDQALRTVSVEY